MDVKVNITKIIDDSSYPTFVEFELVDIHGKRHLFRDKLPIVSFENEIDPPCEGELECKVIKKSGDVITIDTSVPWNVDSVEEETVFEVSAELVFGVAWVDDYNDENEIHTWFGADPTMMYTPNSKQRIDKYIEEHKVCGDYIFKDDAEFLNVLYSNQGRIEVIVWFVYCRISEQEKSLGGGGWIDKQNPGYMWAETPIYEVDFKDKTLNEVLDYIKRIRSEYPQRKMYPAFYLYDRE